MMSLPIKKSQKFLYIYKNWVHFKPTCIHELKGYKYKKKANKSFIHEYLVDV